jgi:hypothetical protein
LIEYLIEVVGIVGAGFEPARPFTIPRKAKSDLRISIFPSLPRILIRGILLC